MKRWIPILAALALAAVLASCSQPATFSIQLGSSSGSVVRGDQVTVQVTVNNASGTVNLSVAGVPSGVTATLADTTLSAGATSTSLDLQVTPAATDGDATVTVNAVDGGNAASATFDLTVTSLSVNGTVVDLFGAGIAGATVAIQGTTDTTDSSGSFTIDGVAVPYDLIVKQTITSSVVAQVFEGLTSETPEVNPYASIVGPSSPPMSATVSGNLSSAVGAGFEAVVCAQSDTIWMTGCDSVAAGATSYSISVGWAAGSSVPYTLHALEVATDSDGFATGYDRYGTASGNVSNGGAPTLDVTWGSTPSSSDITANVNVPAGFGIQDVYGAAALGAMATLPLFDASGSSVTPLPTSFAANVPQLGTGGATLIVAAYPPSTGGAATIAWKRGLSGGSAVTIDLPTPPTLTAPADGATGIGVGSTLSVSSASGATTFIISTSSQVIIVTTTNASITIPDLTSLGMPLVPSGSYSWQVIATPTTTTPEEAAAGWIRDYFLTFSGVQNGGALGSTTDGSIVGTPMRSFTTP